jgi:hypothetical protein
MLVNGTLKRVDCLLMGEPRGYRVGRLVTRCVGSMRSVMFRNSAKSRDRCAGINYSAESQAVAEQWAIGPKRLGEGVLSARTLISDEKAKLHLRD